MDTKEIVKFYSSIPLYAKINIEKAVRRVLGPQYSKEQAVQLNSIVDAMSSNLKESVDKILAMSDWDYGEQDKDRITKLIINSWASETFRIQEDESTVKTYVDAYFEHQLRGFDWHNGNLDNFKELVNPYLKRDELKGVEELQQTLGNEAETYYEDSDIIILIPKTERASIMLGRGTEWCTAYDPDEGRTCHFKSYSEDGHLYIIINKSNPSEHRFQLHFETGQFADIHDRMWELYELINEIPQLKKAFLNKFKKYLSKVSAEKFGLDYVLDSLISEEGRESWLREDLKTILTGDTWEITQNWNISSRTVHEIIPDLSPENTKLLHQYVITEIPNWEESYTYISHVIEDELSDLYDALTTADRRASESGTETDMIKSVKSQFDSILESANVKKLGEPYDYTHFQLDISNKINDENFIFSETGLLLIELAAKEEDTEVLEALAPEGQNITEPHNGYWGYDESVLNEIFQEEMYGLTPSPEKVATKKVVKIYSNYPTALNLIPTFDEWLKQAGGIKQVQYDYDVDLEERYYYLKESMTLDENDPEYEQELEDLQKQAFYEDIENQYDEFYGKYDRLNFPIEVFRCVSLPIDPQEIEESWENKGVGIYWSDNENYAICHGGSYGGDHKEFIFSANVQINDVDWNATLHANMHPDLGTDEQEITLKEHISILLTGVKSPNPEYNMGNQYNTPKHLPWEDIQYMVKT